jgi:hypothetical protein
MISRKNFSITQKIMLLCDSATESLARRVPLILTAGLIGVAVVYIQKEINRKVEITCNSSIYEIVHHPTAIGPAYQCVSRAQLRGPAPALKD